MKNKYVFLISIVTSAGLTACSSAPSKGSPEYVREQVYSCRMLCANGEVNITKIEGLDCVCNKPQQPFIYNPMMSGGNGGGGSSSSSTSSGSTTSGTNSSNQSDRAPASVFQAAPIPAPLTPNSNAAHTTDATGREIISQTKE